MGLWQVDTSSFESRLVGSESATLTALAIDARGSVWAAAANAGVIMLSMRAAVRSSESILLAFIWTNLLYSSSSPGGLVPMIQLE